MAKISLVYVGKRIFDMNKGKLAPAFKRADYAHRKDSKEYYFSKAKWCIVGHVYEAEETNGDMRMYNVPKQSDTPVAFTDELLEEWSEKDHAARDFAERKRLSNQAGRKAEKFVRSSYEFRSMLSKMHYREKRNFLEACIDECEKLERNGK